MNLLKILANTTFNKQYKYLNKKNMKKFILLFITSLIIAGIRAQNSSDYIDEAYALFKIKSFNIKNNTKRCEILTYIRVADKYKDALYYIELLPNDIDNVIFRDILDFNDLSRMVVAKSHRQKGDVYEFNFGIFNITEYAKMKLIIVYPDGSSTTIPIELTDYKNPITIMN